MANKKPTNQNFLSRRFIRNQSNVDQIFRDAETSTYGTSNNDDIFDLDTKFSKVMNTEINELKQGDGKGHTSFLARLMDDENRKRFSDKADQDFLSSIFDMNENTNITEVFSTAYKNKIVKLADIEEVSSNLIELKEAIGTMRDAICSPDVNEGRLNRLISFGDDGKNDSFTPIVENIEKKMELDVKVRNFIAYHALQYGTYYAYTIPYSHIFNKFMKRKESTSFRQMSSFMESAKDPDNEFKTTYKILDTDDTFMESVMDVYDPNMDKTTKAEFTKDMNNILDRVSINTGEVPLPIIEEGFATVEEFGKQFGAGLFTEESDVYSDTKQTLTDTFKKFMNDKDNSDGTYYQDGKEENGKFEEIQECYNKMLTPLECVPIKLMNESIGYIYIQTREEIPLNGLISASLINNRYNDNSKEREVVDKIAGRIIDKFDQKFIKENPKFKKLITEAINYYDLRDKSICFHFIPKEYIFEFSVNRNEKSEGVSMLDGSLFYAKLYLMLLLFKMMSIVINSNDTKVNYIKDAGINKKLVNKTQSIAIQKQQRNINLYDMFSYNRMANKVASGTELFLPAGKNGERGWETEILSGQEVQLNTELMELLRNSYILATGVPMAIMNYLNEADFAKSIEVANTKFNGRVINYQLDLNPQITKWYQAILGWCTNIPKDVVNRFTFTLPSPRTAQVAITNDEIANVTSITDYAVAVYFGQDIAPEKEDEVRELRKKVGRKYLPSFDWDDMDKIFEENRKEAIGKKLEPTQEIDDTTELSDELSGM